MADEIVAELVNLLRMKLMQQFGNWLQSSLNRDSVHDIIKNLQQSVESISMKELKSSISDETVFKDLDDNEIMTKVRTDLMLAFRSLYNTTQRRLETFVTNLDKHLSKKLPSDAFAKILDNAITASERSVKSEETLRFIRLGRSTLEKEYHTIINKSIDTKTRELILQDSVQTMKAFYKKQMEKPNDNQHPVCPNLLLQRHELLVHKLFILFKDILSGTAGTNDLAEQLSEEFEEVNTANMRKFLTYQQNIKRLIEKGNSEYINRMEQILKDNPGGIDIQQLNVRHEAEMKNATFKLTESIQETVSEVEPIKMHVATLEKHILKSFSGLERQNQKSCENFRKNSTNKNINDRFTEPRMDNAAKTNVKSYATNYGDANEISMDIDGNPLFLLLSIKYLRIVHHHDGEQEKFIKIPAKIGLSPDEKWVSGDEVSDIEAVKAQNFHRVWKLKEFWQGMNGLSSVQYSTFINGYKFVIDADFILALLFANARNRVAPSSLTDVSRILIGVPFWFSSFQRQQIVNGATIAGFKTVKLVNENTAWAYFAYCDRLHEPNYNTVVISENSKKIDITLFSFDKQMGILSMEGHVGDYECIHTDNRVFIKGNSRLITSIKPSTNEGNEKLQMLLQLWQLCCNRADGQRPGIERNPIKVVVVCESDNLKLLHELAVKISNRKPTLMIKYNTPCREIQSAYKAFFSDENTFAGKTLKEGMPFDLLFYDNDSKLSCLRKVDTFSVCGFDTRKVHVTYAKCINVFEVLPEMTKLVGTICLSSIPRKEHKEVVIIIRRDSDGVLDCEEVAYATGIKEHYYSQPDTKILSSPQDYEWKPNGLSIKKINAYKSLVGNMKRVTGLTATTPDVDVEEAFRKAAEVKKQIEEGKIKFKGSLAKTVFLQQLDDEVNVLKASGVCPTKQIQAVKAIQSYFATYIVS